MPPEIVNCVYFSTLPHRVLIAIIQDFRVHVKSRLGCLTRFKQAPNDGIYSIVYGVGVESGGGVERNAEVGVEYGAGIVITEEVGTPTCVGVCVHDALTSAQIDRPTSAFRTISTTPG